MARTPELVLLGMLAVALLVVLVSSVSNPAPASAVVKAHTSGQAATTEVAKSTDAAKPRFTAEQSALIARHEIAPGLTRASAIDMLGFEDDAIASIFMGTNGHRGGGMALYGDVTREMVIASWGEPYSDKTFVVFPALLYLQPPDGAILVVHGVDGKCLFVVTVVTADYLARKFPTWTRKQCEDVAAGNLALGMAPEMARIAWGKPTDIKRSVGSWGVREQCVYDSAKSIFFENGVITSWTESVGT